MIEILGQGSEHIIIGAGGVGAAIGGLSIWMFKRSLSRTLDHVDNQGIHIDPKKKMVTEDICKLKHKALERLLEEKFNNMGETLARIEEKIDGNHRG